MEIVVTILVIGTYIFCGLVVGLLNAIWEEYNNVAYYHQCPTVFPVVFWPVFSIVAICFFTGIGMRKLEEKIMEKIKKDE